MNDFKDYNPMVNGTANIIKNITERNGEVVKGSNSSVTEINDTYYNPLYWERNKHVNKIMLMHDRTAEGNKLDSMARDFMYAVGIQPLLLIFMVIIMGFLPTLNILFNGGNDSFVGLLLISAAVAYTLTAKLNGYILYKMFSGNIIKEYNYSDFLSNREAATLTEALNYYSGVLEDSTPNDDAYNTIHYFLDGDNVARNIDDLHDIKDRLIYNIRRCDKRDVIYHDAAVISADYIYHDKRDSLYLVSDNSNSLTLNNNTIATIGSRKIIPKDNGDNDYYDKLFKKLKKMDSRLANLSVIYYNLRSDSDYSSMFDVIVNELADTYSIIRESIDDGISDGALEAKLFAEIVDVVSPKLDEIMESIRADYHGDLISIKNNLSVKLDKD